MIVLELIETLRTFGGFWNAIAYVVGLAIILLFVYFLYRLGERRHKKGAQAQIFLSGYSEPEKEALHIRAKNIYWGFMEAYEKVYRIFRALHTGNVNDYVIAFVGMMALLMIVIAGGMI